MKMYAQSQHRFRKSFMLVILLAIGVSILFFVGLLFGYQYIRKVVESEFYIKKVQVLDLSTRDYNNLFFIKIPEVSFYQGYLDSAGAAVYADSILTRYPFVQKIIFYDAQLTKPVKQLDMSARQVFQYSKEGELQVARLTDLSKSVYEDFYNSSIKFENFIELADTSRSINNDEISRYFYSVMPGKITYLNIPRKEDVKVFKSMLHEAYEDNGVYEQDVFTYYIDPAGIPITNNHPELYEYIEIKPLFYTMLDTDPDLMTSETALPGALSGYKLYFVSDRKHLNQEILHRFMPLAIYITLAYLAMFVIGGLIYRNIQFNHRMFKLQYDFINNLTHEFKTPVSVIKIAGNNIKSGRELTERLRQHYGRILDEEADKLNRLLNTLLSFTQIENRSIQLKQESIALGDFCRVIVDRYSIRYPDFDIRCHIDERLVFCSDKVLLESVFQNLIDNAYKYSEEGKKKLDISISAQKKYLHFVFKDEGIGIASSEQANIFKKFYRVESSYNQQGSVGLGLAFCKELINFMHGTITVKSAPDQGAVFTVILPYVREC